MPTPTACARSAVNTTTSTATGMWALPWASLVLIGWAWRPPITAPMRKPPTDSAPARAPLR